MKPKFIKFYDLRLKRDWFVNPEYVLSFYAEGWPNTPAKSCIEVKGHQGYHNHDIYVADTLEEIHAKLTEL